VRACGLQRGPDLTCEHLFEKTEMAFLTIIKPAGGGFSGG